MKFDFPNYSQRVSKNHSQLKIIFHFSRVVVFLCLPLTARQYGEVVLPDPAPTEASGASIRASRMRGTGTPRQRGQKAVTVQGGYGALFAVRVQILLSITRVAVQS